MPRTTPRRHATKRNPLSRYALRKMDLKPGDNITQYSAFYGTLDRYVVLRWPGVRGLLCVYPDKCNDTRVGTTSTCTNPAHANWGFHRVVLLRHVATGRIRYHFMDDMGITPSPSGTWNTLSCAINTKHEREIRSPRGPLLQEILERRSVQRQRLAKIWDHEQQRVGRRGRTNGHYLRQ